MFIYKEGRRMGL